MKRLVLAVVAIAAASAIGQTTFLTEDFESAFVNGAPPGWTKSIQAGTSDWTRFVGDNRDGTYAHGGYYNAILFDENNDDSKTYMITPVINFGTSTSNATLEFWHQQASWDLDQDTLEVYYKTSASGEWTLLASYTSNTTDWTKRTISLPNTNSTYYIGFLGNSKWGYGVCIDDVKVYGDKPSDGVTNYYAVVCGVSNYQYVNDLSYCDDDARDIRDVLLASGGWNSANITVLIDKAATKQAIQRAIQNMAIAADDDDVCLFFFSGHGTGGEDVPPYDEIDGYDEYIVTYNSNFDDYANDISDDELGEWIGGLPTSRCVVILDTCFSGGQIKGLGSGKGLGNIVPQKGDGFAADIAAVIKAEDIDDNGKGVVLTACDDDEVSEEDPYLQNGVFTYYLVQGMAGAADSNRDNRISAEESYNYARTPTMIHSPIQYPQIYDAFAGELEYIIYTPVISKCTVKAGSTADSDKVSISGLLKATTDFLASAGSIVVTIDSNDLNLPCALSFPVDGNTFKNGKFSCSKTEGGVKKSLKYDPLTEKFSFSASYVDLTGLDCPVTMEIESGYYDSAVEMNETKVNGKKPIPINLLMGIKDSLRVDKLKVKRGTNPNTDSLSVKGGFSVLDTDVDMFDNSFAVTLGSQTFTIPSQSFLAKSNRFTCKKVSLSDSSVALADFNFTTGAFTLTIKYAEIAAEAGEADLRIEFADFNESDEVVLP